MNYFASLVLFLFVFTQHTAAQEIEYVYPKNAVKGYEEAKEVTGDETSLNFFQGSLAEALEKAKRERKLVFLDFYADWCTPCKLIEKEVFRMPKFRNYVHKNFVVYKIYGDNFDSGDYEYAQEMGVKEWPTLMVLNSEGEEMGRISGYKTANTYLLGLKRIERFSAYRR